MTICFRLFDLSGSLDFDKCMPFLDGFFSIIGTVLAIDRFLLPGITILGVTGFVIFFFGCLFPKYEFLFCYITKLKITFLAHNLGMLP